MIDDPRKAKTVGEACENGDGTYNGYRLLSWLSEAVNPGKGFSFEEIQALAKPQIHLTQECLDTAGRIKKVP